MKRWDSEKADLVRELYPTHSASIVAAQIEKKFGGHCSRNSVMGLVNRKGLQKGGMGRDQKFQIPPSRKKDEAVKEKPRPPRQKPQLQYKPRPASESIQCPCQIIDLENYNCRWPFGDPLQPGFYFCGAVTVPDQVYCPTHMRLSYGYTAEDRPWLHRNGHVAFGLRAANSGGSTDTAGAG